VCEHMTHTHVRPTAYLDHKMITKISLGTALTPNLRYTGAYAATPSVGMSNVL